ncbi:type IV pilus biogenesis protein PilM [Halalkalibacter wakoensis JCM 9140]|uniref:Type IV pilus biogenesis protein PilM n=1 Tax=Halalkalibacter wakoensis JCM 9140 TaxID=1236970 RepID=W4Q9B9_9BACI|nr:pilus assembly protein PilM [Halalkalibacter wakoensis]GAE28595.1 type IV pilus biogenesis protein PilM [Halalkalibacter wakoensis JCM 9140]
MLSFNLRNSKSISLVIKDHVIRSVTVNQNELTTPVSYGEKYLPPGIIRDGKILDRDQLLLFLEECVADWGLRKKKVHFVVPESHVFFRKLTLPKSVKKEEIKGYLFIELGNSIPLPFKNPTFDYVLLNEDAEEKEILLFASPEEIIHEYKALLEEAKVTPVSIEINALSMYRIVSRMDKVIPRIHTMFIEFDAHAISLSIFQDDKPQYIHHLVNASQSEQFEISRSRAEAELEFVGDEMVLMGDIQDAIGEIERIMNFYKYSLYKGEQEVTMVFLGGDHPYLHHIFNQLNENLQLELYSSKQLLKEAEIELAPQYLTTMGLAYKEVQS